VAGGSGEGGDPAAARAADMSEPVWADVARPAWMYYEQLDLALARRVGAALWVLGATYTAAVLVTRDPVPAVGWMLALAAVSGALAARLRRAHARPAAIAVRDLLWGTYAGAALVALAQWLGDGELALSNGLLLAAIFASATQPARRAALVLVVVGALAASPLLYGSMSHERPVALAAQILLWWGLAILAMLWTARTRALRQQLQRERERAHELAREDALTGLGNRRALEEALGHEAARAGRTGESVGLLLIDVDRFKSINDRHGHAVGDACLRTVADALVHALRAADSCFRWGGDEFVVLLPDTGLAATREAAARAAASVATRLDPDQAPLSVGIGCAELRGDMTADEVFAAADADLLAAKAARRPTSTS
jgi:diguanylate cyclase (GGDEF)-like protein